MSITTNSPQSNLAVAGVSRDCFQIELVQMRLGKLAKALEAAGQGAYICKTIVETEASAMTALKEVEGQLKPGPTTFFRLQSNAESKLVSYVAEGSILDVDPRSFGSIGVFAIPDFGRFYRHVLIGKRFPHHGAVAFAHAGKALFGAVKLLGVCDVNAPLPAGVLYPGENPFE